MKDDTSTPTPDGTSPNEFERGKPGTTARDDAEAAIEQLRQRGGIFVEAVRATRMPMALTNPNLPGNPIVFANASFLKLSGYSMKEVLGQQPHFMNGPNTDPRDAARFDEAIRGDQDDIIETVQYRKNGSRFIATVLVSAFKDDAGHVLNHFMSWLDVTRRVDAEDEVAELKRVQAKLHEAEERAELALEAAEMGIWDYDLVADVCHFDPRAQKMYNLPSDSLDHEGVASAVHPDDTGPMFDAIRTASDPAGDGRYDIDYRIAQADGQYRWIRAWGRARFEGEGADRRAVRIVGASRDVTFEKAADAALRKSERHANTLLAELQHRVRNTLAVVRSIARRTSESSTSAEDMLAHFQGRLDAFSRLQAALTRSPGEKIGLKLLVEDELIAHATKEGDQVKISGPDVGLEPKIAERVSLAIHELTTNAVKHGALTNGSGHISIEWDRQRSGNGDELVLRWIESGLEIADPEIKREGFGMELLRRSLPYDLDGQTAVKLEPTGLHFEMRIPLLD